jgi:hypothetical protein
MLSNMLRGSSEAFHRVTLTAALPLQQLYPAQAQQVRAVNRTTAAAADRFGFPREMELVSKVKFHAVR